MDETTKLILNLAKEYKDKPEDFINIFENLVKNSQLKDKKGDLFLEAGIMMFQHSYFKLSRALWECALKYFIENKNPAGESAGYTNIGNAYAKLGDFKKAIQYHDKVLKINKDIGDKAGESAGYTNSGSAYAELGDFKKAIEFYDKSLEIIKDIGDKAGESKCYQGLGAAYHSLGDFTKAIEFYEKSLKINRETGDRTGESAGYGNLGNAYAGLGDFNKALVFHEKSLEIYKDTGDKYGEITTRLNIGLIVTGKDREKAKKESEETKKLIKELKIEKTPSGRKMLKIAGDIIAGNLNGKKKIKISPALRRDINK